MKRPRSRYLARAESWLLCLLMLPGWVAESAGLNWHAEHGYRWLDLPVPLQGRNGFTLLPPETTGIFFTNHLSDALAAQNRILQNGSGVALGDADGDGLCDI